MALEPVDTTIQMTLWEFWSAAMGTSKAKRNFARALFPSGKLPLVKVEVLKNYAAAMASADHADSLEDSEKNRYVRDTQNSLAEEILSATNEKDLLEMMRVMRNNRKGTFSLMDLIMAAKDKKG